MTKLTTTMMDSEWQQALKWRERFLAHDPGMDRPLHPLDAQIVCYLVADCMTMRQVHDEQEALTSPHAPSGWQQRIAATDPWTGPWAGSVCRFCGSDDKHAEDCLWLNAVDALPPAPDASPAPTLRPNHFACPTCGPGIAVDEDGCCRTCGADAVAVVADASPAKETPKPPSIWATCTECGAYIPHHLKRKCKGRHVDLPPVPDLMGALRKSLDNLNANEPTASPKEPR